MKRLVSIDPRINIMHIGIEGRLAVVCHYDIEAIFLYNRLLAVCDRSHSFAGRVKYSADIAQKFKMHGIGPDINHWKTYSRPQLEREYQELILKRSMAYMDAILTGKVEYND